LSNHVIWKKVRLVPVGIELEIRRLKWWQQVVDEPRNNRGLIAAIFGTFPFEKQKPFDPGTGVVQREQASPWLLQLCEDLASLCEIDDTAAVEIAANCAEQPLRLFESPFKDFLIKSISPCFVGCFCGIPRVNRSILRKRLLKANSRV
jgi:hypothetical protein